MARIRTIKPEFFTSEDIVGMTPLARILYIALWCEADKEGRLIWKPKTFKMRYLPAEDCNIDSLCAEILGGGLAVLYGEGYAYIPQFTVHQHINPRETPSQLPEPPTSTREARVGTRQPRDSDAQGGREGKEGKGTRDASREFDDFPGFIQFWTTWPASDRKQAKGECLKAWKKAKAEADAALVVAHVERMKQTAGWTKNNGEYIPAPLVYLNKRSWEGAELAGMDDPYGLKGAI
jgi:hypothetical protein